MNTCIRCGGQRATHDRGIRIHWYTPASIGTGNPDRAVTYLALCTPCALIFRAYTLGWAGEPLEETP